MDDRTRRLERAAIDDPRLVPELARAYARGGDYPLAWSTHKSWLQGKLDVLLAFRRKHCEDLVASLEEQDAARVAGREPERFELDEDGLIEARRECDTIGADLANMNRLDQTAAGAAIRKMSMVELTGGFPKFANEKTLPAIAARFGAYIDTVGDPDRDDQYGEPQREKTRRGDVGVVIWMGTTKFGTKVGVKVLRFAVLDQEDVKAGRYRTLFGTKVEGSNRYKKHPDGGIYFERVLPDDPVVFTSIANVDLLERPADEWMWQTFQRDAQTQEAIREIDIHKGSWVDVQHEGAEICGKVFWAGTGKDGVFTIGIQPKGTHDRRKVRFVPGAHVRKLAGPCYCRFKDGRRRATCKSHKKLNPTKKEGVAK